MINAIINFGLFWFGIVAITIIGYAAIVSSFYLVVGLFELVKYLSKMESK